jgi:hypothetical protein
LKTIGACLCAAAALAAAAAPARAQAPPPRVHLLDVPYLPQSEALCGGAAAAMVMRFWGASDVYADTFGDLIDPSAGGIHGEDLVRALRARGWQALTFKGDITLLRSHMDNRRPVIVLVEDRPDRFHYAVVVAVTVDRVVVHDPARAPFRVLDRMSFLRAWERAGFWSLLALPPAGLSHRQPAEPERPTVTAGVCGGMVDEGIRLAQAGEGDAARRVLELASSTCPADAGPWRERAGLHALRSEWPEAARDAREALRRDKSDEHAARILATSLFLQGKTLGALDAWNVAGEPTIDLVNVQGLGRTRYEVAARALRLEPRTLLTSASLRRAERTAAEIPSVVVSRVSYRPAENGRAQVDAVILERPLLPSGVVGLAGVGLRAATDREISAALASPSGGGELWTASWRWWENRPRAAVSFSAPATGGLHGVWRVDAFDDEETYGAASGTAVERRRGAAVQLSDWVTGEWRWMAAAGFDRWRGRGGSVSIAAGLDHRSPDDRLSAIGRASILRGGVDTWTASLGSEWRTRARHEGTVLVTRAGVEAAGTDAPFALWPGAGSGQGRDVLLRAHPLLHDGVISGGAFGQRIAYGGVEWRRWLRPVRRTVRVAPAIFADAAHASRSAAPFDTRLHVDAGVGLRVAFPGSGVLRVDVARGLRDGRTVWSAGWTR